MSSPSKSGNEPIMQRGKSEIKNVYVRRRCRAAARESLYVRLRSQEVDKKQEPVTESQQDCDPSVNDGGMVLDASMAGFMASLNNTQLLQFVELSAAAAAASSNANSLHPNQEPSQP